ncbi:MAG: hypothetical protein WAM82_19455 [Thermoanaerobaculia bacterium]
MQLQLAGYFPKLTAVPPGWTAIDPVDEICSVSTCIAPAPDGWIKRWLHNDLGFYNTVHDASSIIPPGSEGYSVFAYKLLPVRFGDEAEPWPLPDLAVEPLPPSFRSLGFDIASKDLSDFFECSPLSCNGIATEVHVNRYCLVESLERAFSLAERFALGPGVEPGYYHVLEVLRDPG